MYIKNRYISIIYKLIIVVCGFVGIQMQVGLFSAAPNWQALEFFTNLSNLACVVYFLMAAIWLFVNRKKDTTTFSPIFKGIVMMSITVTMLVAQFMLHNFNMNGAMGASLILLHRVVPVMVILDWLLFDKKGWITKFSPLAWVISPLIYFGVVVITAPLRTSIHGGTRYFYPFIDIDKLGVSRVLLTVLLLVIGFIALGYIYYAIDHILAKKQNRLSNL